VGGSGCKYDRWGEKMGWEKEVLFIEGKCLKNISICPHSYQGRR